MDNRRLLFLCLTLGATVVGLIWWIAHQGTERARREEAYARDILKGRRSTRGAPAPLPPRRVARSSKASDRILEVRLPLKDPRAQEGGRVVMVLFGNNRLLRRPDPAKLTFVQNVLGREGADALLTAFLKLPPARGSGLVSVHMTIAAGKRELLIGETALAPLLKRKLPRQSPYLPARLQLRLGRVQAAPQEEPRLRWPFAKPPETFLKLRTWVRAPRSTLKRFFKLWKPGKLLEGPGPAPRAVFAVREMEVL